MSVLRLPEREIIVGGRVERWNGYLGRLVSMVSGRMINYKIISALAQVILKGQRYCDLVVCSSVFDLPCRISGGIISYLASIAETLYVQSRTTIRRSLTDVALEHIHHSHLVCRHQYG